MHCILLIIAGQDLVHQKNTDLEVVLPGIYSFNNINTF